MIEFFKYKDIKKEDISVYKKYYSDNFFWKKIKKIVEKAGLKILCYSLVLYHILQKEEVPLKEKSLIIGALGYFILPLDLIPDSFIGVGYTDDISTVLIVLKKCISYIDEDTKIKVYETLKKFIDIEYQEIENLLKI